jgi:hypothetical protein
MPTNEEIIRRYVAAHERHDGDTIALLRDPDWLSEMPQSGERIRGHANERAIMANWPGGRPEALRARVTGTEDQWVMTPAWTYERIAGQGDIWIGEATARYPDGSRWFAVMVFELRDGRVFRERWYFGEPFEPPAWRAPWVERMEAGESADRR